jgi:hypothetical protein
VAGVEEPHSCGQLRWNIDDLLAGFEEALDQRTARAVGSLDRPDPVWPLLHITSQRGIPRVVGGEPARSEQPFSGVHDLDRGRELVGIDPDDHAFHLLHLPGGWYR